MKRYTDKQITDMLKVCALWMDELREAAKERGIPCTSLTPFAEVAEKLRARLPLPNGGE